MKNKDTVIGNTALGTIQLSKEQRKKGKQMTEEATKIMDKLMHTNKKIKK